VQAGLRRHGHTDQRLSWGCRPARAVDKKKIYVYDRPGVEGPLKRAAATPSDVPTVVRPALFAGGTESSPSGANDSGGPTQSTKMTARKYVQGGGIASSTLGQRHMPNRSDSKVRRLAVRRDPLSGPGRRGARPGLGRSTAQVAKPAGGPFIRLRSALGLPAATRSAPAAFPANLGRRHDSSNTRVQSAAAAPDLQRRHGERQPGSTATIRWNTAARRPAGPRSFHVGESSVLRQLAAQREPGP